VVCEWDQLLHRERQRPDESGNHLILDDDCILEYDN
jgi:hypothetical protein